MMESHKGTVLLDSLLDAGAARHPDAVAVRDAHGALSYSELLSYSNALAVCLQEDGVRTGDRIGICMGKSRWAVASLFGILKSGACYVPLDPFSPPSRQGYILKDCGVQHLVIDQARRRQVGDFIKHGAPLRRVLVMDADGTPDTAEPAESNPTFRNGIISAAGSLTPRQSGRQDGQPAYCLYTSGSTGTPKGVLVSHAASRAFVDWAVERFQLGPTDTVSSHAPYHFDLSVFDLFASVSVGASIAIVPSGASAFPRSLANFIADSNISVWYSVPSTLIQLARYGGLRGGCFPELRLVLFAGEVFQPGYLRQLMSVLPEPAYYNLYGPTETNVCTYYRVPHPRREDRPIPIGIPCPGHRIAVLDATGCPVATGESGELYVDGPTLMSGYWNDAEKTHAAFRRIPLGKGETMTAYKTGDRVSVNKEGLLEYHGRIDDMIKSRGYRIEPAEIERVLAQHPAVAEATVISIPDEDIGARLRAYVIAGPGATPSLENIAQHCAEWLPRYMVPETVCFLKELPRTSTGKVDRQRLAKELWE